MKVLLVSSEGDYAALSFQQAHAGTKVSDIIANLDDYQSPESEDEEGDEDDDAGSWDLSVHEVEDAPEFVKFFRDNLQDYDESKSINFWTESEVVPD